MATWQEWLRLLITLVIIIGFFEMLLPANDLKKLAKLVAGLVLMLAVLQPVLAIVNLNWVSSLQHDMESVVQSNSFQSWEDKAQQISEAGLRPVLRTIENNAETQLENYLKNSFQLPEATVRITLAADGTIRWVRINAYIADQIVLAEERQQLLTKLRQAVADYLQVSASIVQITLN